MNGVEIVRNIAEAIGAKPSQVALAWLLGKGHFIVPIPGTNAVPTLRRMSAPGSQTHRVPTPEQAFACSWPRFTRVFGADTLTIAAKIVSLAFL
jgi:hypothetical protein